MQIIGKNIIEFLGDQSEFIQPPLQLNDTV